MGIPLWVICYFPLAAFNICSLCLIFINLINMCLGVFCLGFILFGTLWVSWTWVAISFPILGKFPTIISSSIFSWPFFLSFSSGTPRIQMLGCFTLSQRSLRFSSFILILFSFFLSASFISTILYSTSLILSSAWVILLLVPSRELFISFIVLFIIHWLFFISSRSLLNFSCIFWILSPDYLSVTPFCFQNFGSFLLLLLWILFQLDSLSPPLLFGLVDFYNVPLPAGYFSAFSSCLGCCFWGALSECWRFVVPLYCGGSCIWVGLDEWLVKVSWLGKLVPVFWWVDLDLFSLECNEVSSSEFWGVYGFGVTVGHLHFCVQGYVPALLEN